MYVCIYIYICIYMCINTESIRLLDIYNYIPIFINLLCIYIYIIIIKIIIVRII